MIASNKLPTTAEVTAVRIIASVLGAAAWATVRAAVAVVAADEEDDDDDES